jgi:UDP:flavonoid glycosyltransferase YjiC (YdhE family)
MAKKILFWPDVYLEQGHWLPTVVWANGLKERGYSVDYMGIEDCASVVSPFGYVVDPDPASVQNPRGRFHIIFPELYPLGYTRENHGSIAERWKTDHVFAIASGELDPVFTGPNKPDLLVSGYFTSLESLMIHYKYNIPVVLTTTFLRHPQQDPAIRALQNMMAFPREVARKLMRQAIGEEAWDSNMEVEDFVKPLEGFYELIPCPREFEFEHYQSGEKVRYVEPCMTPETNDQAEQDFWDSIPKSRSAAGGQPAVKMNYIFATAGSQVQDYEERAENMFRQMVHMMNDPQMKDYYLILAVGPKLAQKNWGVSAKYKVVNWAPQRSILAYEDTKAAFIHGGLATLKECIFNNKPFVLLPLGKDQLDNSLRVQELELGEITWPDNVHSGSLLYAVNKAFSDRWMNQQRTKMSAIFQAAESNAPGLQLLINLLETSEA